MTPDEIHARTMAERVAAQQADTAMILDNLAAAQARADLAARPGVA